MKQNLKQNIKETNIKLDIKEKTKENAKENEKTYYPIGKQKTTIQSSNIIKNDKKQKNCNLKKSTNLAINPFNLSINNNIYEVDKNTVKSFSASISSFLEFIFSSRYVSFLFFSCSV